MKDTLIDFIIVVSFSVILMMIGGCVVATYNATEGAETLEVRTLFKSVDGFRAGRTPQSFDIAIDKTNTQDPIGNTIQMLQLMRSMGMVAPPPVQGNE